MDILLKADNYSIKHKLIRNLSISISILLTAVLFASDRGIDNWIEKEFEKSMHAKAGLLITLVNEDIEGVEFEFADEFMPEFSTGNHLEFFQFWLDGKPFEASESFKPFNGSVLPYEEISINSYKLTNIILPDGRPGKMLMLSFFPQVDSDVKFSPSFPADFFKKQKPMQLAYAVSTDQLDKTLFLVDSFFLLALIISLILVNITVRIVITKGLESLGELNTQLQEIKEDTDKTSITLSSIPTELKEIVNSINDFITEKFKLFDKQKRVTSDIAHELKTPISELINLSEVALRFPADKEISETYHSDILAISLRMKNIVNDIMLLQLSSANKELSIEAIDMSLLLDTILKKYELTSDRVSTSVSHVPLEIHSNRFAIETILNNVINNAVFYSPKNTIIQIVLNKLNNDKQIEFKISNQSTQALQKQDLEFIFDPLWQKDSSRTATDRFGLGLSIVESFCEALNAQIKVALEKDDRFTLSITL